MPTGLTRVLYGAGSSIIVDFEETCRRLGCELVAVIANVAGETFTSCPERLLSFEDVTDDILAHPVSVPIFSPGHRMTALRQARERGVRDFSGLIDPTAIVPKNLICEQGVYINAGVTLGAQSHIHEFSLINRSASLGHHNSIGAFASIGPGVVTGGLVAIGRGSVVGVGAVILPEIVVGENSVVAAGSA